MPAPAPVYLSEKLSDLPEGPQLVALGLVCASRSTPYRF